MTTLSKHYCKDPILPLYWHRNWLKKLIVIRLMLQYLFESCLPRFSGPKRFLIILIPWFRRDSKQRVSIISEPVLFIYLSFIIRELSYVIRGLFQNRQPVSQNVSDDSKFTRVLSVKSLLKLFWPNPESSQQKRSKKVCDKYGTSWVKFHECLWIPHQTRVPLKYFIINIETKFNANILYLKVWRRRLKWNN